MRVTSLTQPRCKITYKYLNIKILQQICLIVRHKDKIFLTALQGVSYICFMSRNYILRTKYSRIFPLIFLKRYLMLYPPITSSSIKLILI